MKKIVLCISSFLLLACSYTTTAQDADAMKAWQDYMTPGAMHKMLAKEIGTWEADVNQWMDPSAPPNKMKATNLVTMSMNGLFQIGNFSADMMGMPMTGQSTTGYDNAKKIFVSSWIDNLGSGMVRMTGNFDEATKTLHLKGTQTDPMTGNDSEIREVIKWHDENSYTMTMYGAGPDGKEMKFMEGTFNRKK
jgi:Protein of unknown function (DUF1579)